MVETMLVIALALGFLVGTALGVLVQEHATRQRERRVAAQIRELNEERRKGAGPAG